MPKIFDVQVLNTTIMGVVQETFKKMLHVDFSGQPAVIEKNIIEYQSRMRVFPMEKFNGAAYVAYVNYFLSDKDIEKNKVVGTFVLFVKEDIGEKLLKAFGVPAAEADNENVMMDNVGEFCNIIAGNVSNELAGFGYVNLSMSSPYKAKNSVPEGIPFDYALYHKQEIAFTFWNQKCIVIEACMGEIPQKGK
ncbi:MAG: chemotaxis protein CheX [Candidatus Omnitrophota bacterium]